MGHFGIDFGDCSDVFMELNLKLKSWMESDLEEDFWGAELNQEWDIKTQKTAIWMNIIFLQFI